MANEKIINTRIQLKYDSYENWSKSAVSLKSGEIAIAYLGPTKTTTTPDNGSHPILFKVGPGKFNDLPWASALAADVYAWAKKEHLEVSDLPTLPITVVDTEEGKFVTDIEYANDTITIHRGSVAWGDIQSKPNLVNSVKTTDDDVVILAPETAASGDVTITGAHKKYDKAGSTSDVSGDATTAGSSVTIKVPTLTVDAYGHAEFNGETSHTITIPNEVAVGDGNITIEAGSGLATGGSFNVNQDADITITLDHADTSSVANVVAADRTYVKSLTFDDFGHVTAVDVGTETVENTAHSHVNGNGTKVSAAGGIDGGDVKVNLNIAMYLDDNQNIVIYDRDDTSKTALASLPAADFIKDGMLDDVSYDAATNTLTFTWNTAAGTKTDTVTLSDIIDPYVFTEGAFIDIEQSGTNITISHEEVAAPTESAGSGRKYLTGVTTDGYGHITGFTTASEVDQDLSGKKNVQDPVANKITKSAHVLSELSQDANGNIKYEVKELAPGDIGAKAVQSAVNSPAASGSTLAFIDTISQNEQGVITATKKNVDLSNYALKSELPTVNDGKFTVKAAEGGALTGSGEMTANQAGNSEAVLDIAEKGVTNAHIADKTISAEKTKAYVAKAGDASEEVWVFYCGSASVLVD